MNRLNDPKYCAWRLAVLKRDDYTCAVCHAKSEFNQPHHKKPWAIFIEDRYDVDNGITICAKCHAIFHGYEKGPSELDDLVSGWTFDCDVCGQTISQRHRAGGDKIPNTNDGDGQYSICDSCAKSAP